MTIKQQIGEYLASEGLRPQEEEYGYFFRYQMLNFIVRWDPDDEHFLNIMLPSIFDVDENNRGDVLEAANKVNMGRKVVKCVVTESGVWLVAEQLLDTDPNYQDVIPRTLDMLMQGRKAFYSSLRELM